MNSRCIGEGMAKSLRADAEICEPDYEAMLQRRRKQLEKVKSDIKAFEDMDDYYWEDNNSRAALTGLYGAMHMKAKEHERGINEVLNMIDKD
jgi:gamma-glutamyl:cysteine ligase YbdK (ATP-grasp superfamily)